jgi:hypothetical protein
MKRSMMTLLIVSLLFIAGCNRDKDAQDYANKLSIVLKSYQGQVNNKIKAEQDSYQSLATYYARAQEENVIETLYLERSERSLSLADEVATRRFSKTAPITLSELQDRLRDYSSIDFQQARTTFEDEMDVSSKYLANLEDLAIEAKNIQELTQSLDDLAKPKGQRQQLKELATFAQHIDEEFEKMLCEDLAKEKKCLNKQLNSETDEARKKMLEAKIKLLDEKITERLQANKCPDLSSIKCPDTN